jgi:hypothetical protein
MKRGDDGSGVKPPVAGGVTSAPPPTRSAGVTAPPSGWKKSGDATVDESGKLVLTPAAREKTGSVVYQTPLVTDGLIARFTLRFGGGDGGDGTAFMLLDAGKFNPENALGAGGGGLGFSGLTGVAVAFVTYPQANDPKGAFVGISAEGEGRRLTYVATATAIPDLRSGEHAVEVRVAKGVLTVSIDKTKALEVATSVPANAYVGFSAATGGRTDVHEVSGIDFSY